MNHKKELLRGRWVFYTKGKVPQNGFRSLSDFPPTFPLGGGGVPRKPLLFEQPGVGVSLRASVFSVWGFPTGSLVVPFWDYLMGFYI